ncbi:P-loop containing nucleoside triphosphate hydrolase protein [Daldinia sp. FL1419]|nr:P-loop containing nucleoside triphosphate hydrolase protein [Daldinia sp. FL1419]
MNAKPLWLLLSDIHFGSRDLDRVIRTSNWIASLPKSHTRISRAIICGDLLFSRTSQPTHVLSACYRFLNKLVDGIPHVDIILGNHDLAYRLDYTTSALEALSISRLAPFVTLHDRIGSYKWDGRRVFVMPFREDQSQIITAIHALDPKSAAETVGFGHLAINRAVTQKFTVDPETGKLGSPTKYPGITGVNGFAPLARTFTGHFHSHQTILQATNQEDEDPRGSITYIGAPLQLTWADLFDDMKGVILLDPETLEAEHVRNPHAVGYVSISAQDILSGQVDQEHIHDRHVMITGRVSRYKYVLARESLVKLGARSVRDWKPFEPEWNSQQKGLGKTMLPIDVQNLPKIESEKLEGMNSPDPLRSVTVSPSGPIAEQIRREPIDLGRATEEYVSSLSLGSTLESRRELLVAVGKRLMQIGGSVRDKTNDAVKYEDVLNQTIPLALPSNKHASIFVAHPVAIEITNFLGVQGSLKLHFQQHFQPGMNFLVGKNGAGKSTIIEAIVWCQFGQCVRSGLGVNDVINDVVGKDCSVRLTFSNGYSISRYRKHGEFQNRVIVEKDGITQPQFEGPSAKNSQESINELLGVDYDTFTRTIMLGNESTKSFLSASPLQKRQLIEAALGLGVLDDCAETCNLMTSEVDEKLGEKQSRLKEVTHTITHLKGRVYQMIKNAQSLLGQSERLINELQREDQKHFTLIKEKELKINKLRKELESEKPRDLQPELSDLRKNVSEAHSEVGRLGALSKVSQARLSIDRKGAVIKQEVVVIGKRLDDLEKSTEHLLEENEVLVIPPSLTQESRDEAARSNQGIISTIMLVLKNIWTSTLKFITAISNKPNDDGKVEAERWHSHTRTIATLNDTVKEAQNKITELANTITNFSNDPSRQSLMIMTLQEASRIPTQLSSAIEELQRRTSQYERLQRQHEGEQQKYLRKQHELEKHEREINTARQTWKTSLDRYHLMIVGKEKEIATYIGHLQSDAESLLELVRQSVMLRKETAEIHSHKEIFAFWQSAFTRRQVTRTTFRQHVAESHFGELNKLLGQILLVMYQDANYARNMTSGTIGALFKEDGNDGDHEDQESTSVLEPSLSMNPALDYAKRSGGERKRVDLALFFAIFMMAEARSPHMAKYMLVDESFDNLDATGQASVLKWCRWMTERLSYVFVITHSPNLIKLAEEEGSTEGGVGANIVTIKAGSKGTELVETSELTTTLSL